MLQNERKQGAFPDEFGKNCVFNPFPMKIIELIVLKIQYFLQTWQ